MQMSDKSDLKNEIFLEKYDVSHCAVYIVACYDDENERYLMIIDH
jgi:hypothetical protein